MVKKILFSAISAILVSSCASQENVKTESVHVVTAACETRLRNLTLPWSDDIKSCTENRDPGEEQAKIIQRQLERNAMLAEKRQQREKDFAEQESDSAIALPMASPVINETATEPEQLQDDSVSMPVNAIEQDIDNSSSSDTAIQDDVNANSIAIISSDEPDEKIETGSVVQFSVSDNDTLKIWFAENHHVLGPEGKQTTIDLGSMLQGSGKIKLRGVLLATEANGLDQEVFSVARALAVKRALIREVRIDPDRITILHYSPKYQGRYVEVLLNG